MKTVYDKNEFFKEYFSRATEKKILVDRLVNRIGRFGESPSVLDLGCHDGALTSAFVEASGTLLPKNLKIVGVEPSASAIEIMKGRSFGSGRILETHVGTAEEYFDSHAGIKHDWIIASQCLYWSRDLKSTVRAIAECAHSAVIVLRGDHGIYEVQSKFRHFLGNAAERLYTQSDVEAALIELEVPFEKQTHSTLIRLPENGSSEMELLISFFLQRRGSDISSEMIEEVSDFLHPKAPDMRHDVSFFWLGKALSEGRAV